MTLFVDEVHAAAWRRAVDSVTDMPLTLVEVGGTLRDPSGRWASVRGTAPDGAILVRPDRHVAWRAATAPVDPAAALSDVLRRLLRPSARSAEFHGDLASMTEAGESLRATSARAPSLFRVIE